MRRNVKWVAENIVNGIEETHTIWDVTVETRENATVEVPVSRKEKYIVGRNRVSKLMCNYFSFGLDARIGFAFEKRDSLLPPAQQRRVDPPQSPPNPDEPIFHYPQNTEQNAAPIHALHVSAVAQHWQLVFFVNPKSGSGEGADLLKPDFYTVEFKWENDVKATCYFYNVLEERQLNNGFARLISIQKQRFP